MNKDEIIGKYVNEIYKKLDSMYSGFVKLSTADKRHMENGFRYAVTESVKALSTVLDDERSVAVAVLPKDNKEDPKKGKIKFDGKQFGKDILDFLGG